MMLGKRQLFRRTVQAIAAERLLSPLGYRQYLHGQVMRHPDGGYVVEPLGDGDEAMLARMARADGLIVIHQAVTEAAARGAGTVMPLVLGGRAAAWFTSPCAPAGRSLVPVRNN